MAPTPDQHGSNIDPCWIHVGSNMGPCWTHVGSNMGAKGTIVARGPQGTIVARDPNQTQNGTFSEDFTPEKWPLKNLKNTKKIRKKNLYIFIVESFQYLFSRASFEYFHFPSKILVLSKNSNFVQKFWFLPEQNFCPNGLTKPRKITFRRLLRGSNAD